ncbi:ATP-dependent DNA helicase [Arcanobacterium haemolyticum]|uniref:Helicase c2 n=1 Tax=Arcanobacterium haemolyticum (strain ATCC 9345 / DSM 20595 / CCM 5947 / CCUG 17215 / LMG 16163 / NBRC 15585 / NCTC 8452 / 11018) TaxID=644284 RepID=D7BN90_ARCHD|nr:ATP-dependent DNA helicase [Arcanobacterium haemolyticum]ADH92389.1 helicase c2 [Arcanobacterium haemolyticum DSM 20595]SQH28883.1 Probable ATP-dependent helicase dinG homolog [Arcanobacterium haemolyticum]
MSDLDALLSAVVRSVGGSPREGQIEMAERVSEALESDGHLLVQAGTGTGKSFGYLVPTMAWAAATGKRAVISTATLALQRQIMLHDAPRVKDAIHNELGAHVNVALLKGWHNYVCLRKATGGYPEEGTLLSRAEGEVGATATGEEVIRAREWAMSTDTGDRDDLVPGVTDRVWGQVSVPKRECIGEKCPVRQSCFPYLAREAAEESDVVVTNHAMLGIAATGTPVLPETQAFIIDEAHELVDRVTNQLTRTLSKYDVAGIARMMRSSGLDDSDLDESADEIAELLTDVPEGRIVKFSQVLFDAIARLSGRVAEAGENVAGMSGKDEDQTIAKQILRSRLVEVGELCEDLLSGAIENETLVAWKAEFADGTGALYAAPLDVAGAIADELFDGRPTILTSATLKINDSFDVMAARVGLSFPSQGPWEGIDVGSPFTPEKQGVLYVAKHLPIPGKEGYGDEQLTEMVELIEASGGGALVLFTSKAAAIRAAEFARDRLEVPIFVQGEDQLSTLVSLFSDDDDACLFGTISLWQGVDVPGRTCRLVIMDRIPFPRPNDPLMQARSQAVAHSGGNGFMNVAATQAALLLAQGAGRLLRRSTDRGVVAVLDPRLRTARYSGFLLASMPKMWPTTDPQIVRGVLQRLASEGSES